VSWWLIIALFVICGALLATKQQPELEVLIVRLKGPDNPKGSGVAILPLRGGKWLDSGDNVSISIGEQSTTASVGVLLRHLTAKEIEVRFGLTGEIGSRFQQPPIVAFANLDRPCWCGPQYESCIGSLQLPPRRAFSYLWNHPTPDQ